MGKSGGQNTSRPKHPKMKKFHNGMKYHNVWGKWNVKYVQDKM
jgi:hypothetical protein